MPASAKDLKDLAGKRAGERSKAMSSFLVQMQGQQKERGVTRKVNQSNARTRYGIRREFGESEDKPKGLLKKIKIKIRKGGRKTDYNTVQMLQARAGLKQWLGESSNRERQERKDRVSAIADVYERQRKRVKRIAAAHRRKNRAGLIRGLRNRSRVTDLALRGTKRYLTSPVHEGSSILEGKLKDFKIKDYAKKHKGVLAGTAVGLVGGAYLAHKARKKFEREVDKEVYLRKARYNQLVGESDESDPKLPPDKVQQFLLTKVKDKSAKTRAVVNDPQALRHYKRLMRWGTVKRVAGVAGDLAWGAGYGALVGGAAGSLAAEVPAVSKRMKGVSDPRKKLISLGLGTGAVLGTARGVQWANQKGQWHKARAHTKALDKAYNKKLDREYKARMAAQMEPEVKEALIDRIMYQLQEAGTAIVPYKPPVTSGGSPPSRRNKNLRTGAIVAGAGLAAAGAGHLIHKWRVRRRIKKMAKIARENPELRVHIDQKDV